jgi:branched-chain amino acid transport system permease protein
MSGIVRRIRSQGELLGPAGVVLLVVLMASMGTLAQQRTVMLMLVHLVFVVGLFVFIGNSGVLSFGHASFMGIGAYTTALLTIPEIQKGFLLPNLPGFLAGAQAPEALALLAGAMVAMLVALLLAVPLMRLSGLPAGIATLAVLIIVFVVLSQSVTGETRTLVGVPLSLTLGKALFLGLAAIAIAHAFSKTGTALRLRATREDEVAARSVGIGVTRERTIAFVISAGLVGVSGSMFAHLQGSITPDAFYFEVTFLTLAMLVVGGMNSLWGAVVGTVVLTAIAEVLRQVEKGVSLGVVDIPERPGLTEVGLGLLLLVILIVRPEGITRGREFDASRLGSLRRKAAGFIRRPGSDGGAGSDPAGDSAGRSS